MLLTTFTAGTKQLLVKTIWVLINELNPAKDTAVGRKRNNLRNYKLRLLERPSIFQRRWRPISSPFISELLRAQLVLNRATRNLECHSDQSLGNVGIQTFGQIDWWAIHSLFHHGIE
jgi:hypothetical protein